MKDFIRKYLVTKEEYRRDENLIYGEFNRLSGILRRLSIAVVLLSAIVALLLLDRLL